MRPLNEVKLNRKWAHWKKVRVWQLTRHGVPAGEALEFVNIEARGRQRLARAIGRPAAELAPLRLDTSGGVPRFTLSGPISGLTPQQFEALHQLGAHIGAHITP